MGDPLSDGSPLINAAVLGKLRLVRLLLEGGAQVNECNPRGETPLLAACKALRGEPTGPQTLKVLAYLLKNKADPNAQDRTGRTPLMYACIERAGAQVASTLLSAGADPSMEDYSGASALVYAINAQHQPTLQVLLDACRATGRDIIIIATDMGVSGGPVTRRYLNVPPSPDNSPVSCMSPSDIVLKTGSPSSPEGDNVFNFRGTGKRGSSSSRFPPGNLSPVNQSGTPPPRERMWSEPWLAIHNLAHLNRVYEEGMGERSLQEEGEGEEGRREERDQDNEKKEQEDGRINIHSRVEGRRKGVVQEKENRYRVENYYDNCHEDPSSRVSRSLLSLTEEHPLQAAQSRWAPERGLVPGGPTSDMTNWKSSVDKLPPCPSPHWQDRRNTLPSLMVIPPPLQLPPLVNQSESHLQVPSAVSPSKGASAVFPPNPPNSSPSSPSLRVPLRPASLPPLPHTSSVTSLVAAAPPASLCIERGRISPRRGRGEELNLLGP